MKYLLLVFSCILGLNAFAQRDEEKDKWKLPHRYKMIGINTTPLLVQLIPFNRTSPVVTGPFNVEFHRFKGEKAFHTSLGVFISPDDNFESDDNTQFNFRLGMEKRRWSAGRWAYYSGWDVYFSVGSLNFIGVVQDDDSAVLGLGPRWSIGYGLGKNVSLSIETALLLGLDLTFGTAKFVFVPPVALNLNFVIPREDY